MTNHFDRHLVIFLDFRGVPPAFFFPIPSDSLIFSNVLPSCFCLFCDSILDYSFSCPSHTTSLSPVILSQWCPVRQCSPHLRRGCFRSLSQNYCYIVVMPVLVHQAPFLPLPGSPDRPPPPPYPLAFPLQSLSPRRFRVPSALPHFPQHPQRFQGISRVSAFLRFEGVPVCPISPSQTPGAMIFFPGCQRPPPFFSVSGPFFYPHFILS